VVNTILREADLFCPNSVRINFTIYQIISSPLHSKKIIIDKLEENVKLLNFVDVLSDDDFEVIKEVRNSRS
ncbi:hypothetical protein, partial [Lactiplantibacillus plantarum]|uniref:hypothetical protein n=1 Tax=Lactiplantibacillus plantarum TaxID=1590 RepID=UPI001BAC3097